MVGITITAPPLEFVSRTIARPTSPTRSTMLTSEIAARASLNASVASEPKQFATEWHGTVCVVQPNVPIVIGNRHRLRELVDEAIAIGSKKIVVDFTGVLHIDAAGMGAMVAVWRRAREQFGATLVLSGLRDEALALFELTRLDTIFAIFPTVAAAIAALEVGL